MSNGHANCFYAVCCPPDSDEQIDALAAEIGEALGWATHKDEKGEGNARAVAAWVLSNFDLAPKGSLQAFKDSIRDYAREGHVKVEPQHGKSGASKPRDEGL